MKQFKRGIIAMLGDELFWLLAVLTAAGYLVVRIYGQ